jgi:hypothetical protein
MAPRPDHQPLLPNCFSTPSMMANQSQAFMVKLVERIEA